jgi:hypothetical protein
VKCLPVVFASLLRIAHFPPTTRLRIFQMSSASFQSESLLDTTFGSRTSLTFVCSIDPLRESSPETDDPLVALETLRQLVLFLDS